MMLPHERPWRIAAIGAVCLLAAAHSGCGGGSGTTVSAAPPILSSLSSSAPPTAIAQAQKSGSPVDPGIVAADNAFGLNLFNALITSSTGNLAISPTSVALVLQMIYNGAGGSTQTGMAKALQLQSLSAQDVDADNAALQASLSNPDPQVQLTIANSLWMHLNSHPVQPAFSQTNQTYYGAQIGDLSGAPDNVNAWVSSATDGLITHILGPDNYAAVVAVVANAIYFKGAWAIAFDPSQTQPAPFTTASGSQVTASMMHQSGNYDFYQADHFQAVRLPYGQKRQLSLVILLPDSSVSLATFLAAINADALNAWIGQLHLTSGQIALPRFTTTFGASLPAALISMGMADAFNPIVADFSGIAASTYLSAVEHQTIIEVDEAGTTAAASTTGTIGITAVSVPFTMTMDHPFFYAIRDDLSGALLFVGTLVNPT